MSDFPRETTALVIKTNDQKVASIIKIFLDILKRTLPTALAYDFSISLPVLGSMITHLGNGEGEAAPITALLALVGMLIYASILPSSFYLGTAFGELKEKEEQLKNLEKNSAEYQKLISEIQIIEMQIARTPRNAIIAFLPYLLSVLPLALSKQLLTALKQDASVANAAQNFFEVYSPFFSFCMPIRLPIEFALLAAKKQIPAMLIADTSLLITIGIQYGLGFWTPLRLLGLGLGGGIGTALTSIGFLIYAGKFFKNMPFFNKIFSWNENDGQQIRSFIKTVPPIYFSVASDMTVSFVASIFAGLLGNDALKKQNIVTQFFNLNMLMTAANSQTTALTISEENGKRHAAQSRSTVGIKHAVIAGALSNIILQLPLALFVFIAPGTFSSCIGASIADPEEIRFLMLAAAAYSFIDGIRFNLLQSSRALGDNAIVSILSFICMGLGVMAAYLVSQYTSLGVTAIPTSLAGGALAGTLVLMARLKRYIANLETVADDEAPMIVATDAADRVDAAAPQIGPQFWNASPVIQDASNVVINPMETPATSEIKYT